MGMRPQRPKCSGNRRARWAFDPLRREVTRHNVSVLVLDGIVSAKRLADGEQAFDKFVHELQAVAIATACTMFMLTSVEGVRLNAREHHGGWHHRIDRPARARRCRQPRPARVRPRLTMGWS